jgi:hypothetical protein
VHPRALLLFVALIACQEAEKKPSEPAKSSDESESKDKKKKPKSDDTDEEEEIRPKKAPGAPAAMMAEAEVKRTLSALFSKFQAGSDFAFFEKYFAKVIDRYITLENVSLEAAQKDARAFFKGKKNVKYTPDYSALVVEQDERGTASELTLKMDWDYEAPSTWGPEAKGKLVSRSVRAKLRILFDETPRIFSYLEKEVLRPKLRVTGETEGPLANPNGIYAQPFAALEGKPTATLPKGAIVEDLGETIEIMPAPKSVIARKVKHAGKEIWTVDRAERVYLVPATTKEDVKLTPYKLAIAQRDPLNALRPDDLKEAPCSPVALEIAHLAKVDAPSVQFTKCFQSGAVELALVGEGFIAQGDPIDELFKRRSKAATMKSKTGPSFVASGVRAGKIFYEKHVFKNTAADYTHGAYVIVYPDSLRASYDEPIKKMNAALSLGVPTAPPPADAGVPNKPDGGK